MKGRNALLVLVLLSCSFQARAGELAPGQRSGDGFQYYGLTPPFSGDVIATRTTPFEVSVVSEDVRYFQQGTFTERVIREAGTGAIGFVYDVSAGQANATADLIEIIANGFGGFSTDVFSNTEIEGPIIFRSADGDRLRSIYGDEPPHGGLAVLTDARAYGEGGTVDFSIRFQGGPGGTPDQIVTFPTFRPVPEPASAALLLTACGLAMLRRTRGTRR